MTEPDPLPAGWPELTVASVIVDVRPIQEPLDYLIPADLDISIGSVVRVPLHGRRVRGWVSGLQSVSDVAEAIRHTLKPIVALLTDTPVASPRTLDLARHAAEQYAGSQAAVLAWATPTPLPRGAFTGQAPAPRTDTAEIADLATPIAGGEAIQAFIRTWPEDDASATVRALATVLPAGTCALIIAPAGFPPRAVGGVSLLVEPNAVRTRAWEAATSGTARLVIAGRRGPLVPIPNLGLVIVTQEQSGVHKDARIPALDARVLARDLATRARVPFVAIGTSSPIGWEGTLATSALTGRDVHTLTVPGTQQRWPRVEIVDMTSEARGSVALSDRFFAEVRRVTATGGRVLVFLNRKGTARALVCKNCDAMAACELCGALLRADAAELRCARCEFRLGFVACPSCGSDRLRRLGIGVDRLRTELAAAFPRLDVLLASGDDTVVAHRGAVVVGTRVALRHRGLFDLVVLVDPDALLGRKGLRAEEAAFHLLLDAVAAARTRGEGGRVLCQTRRPEAPAIRALQRADPGIFEAATLTRRRRLGLPPFRRILSVESNDAAAVADVCNALQALGGDVLGPKSEPDPRALILVEPSDWPKAATLARRTVLEHTGTRIRLEADPLDPA